MSTHRPLLLIFAIFLMPFQLVFAQIVLEVTSSAPPLPILLYAYSVMGVGGLLAAVGLWEQKRWGLRLSSGIAAVSMLVSGPGLVLAPTTVGKAIALGHILSYALVLVLLALPATRQAVAAARTSVVQA